MADELKDQRVVTMMSPSELQSIDDWMFANRIRSRGEAIRRLCQLGIYAEKVIPEVARKTRDAALSMSDAFALLRPIIDKMPVRDNLAASQQFVALREASLSMLYETELALLQAMPYRRGSDIQDALRLADDMHKHFEGLAGDDRNKSISELIRGLATSASDEEAEDKSR